MTDTMTAVVYHGQKDIRVGTVPIPPCGDGEIRARVDACAVCGSDLKMYLHGNPRIKPPMVMGHEFTAVVETVGSNVDGFSKSDRIVMATSVSCGECYYCRRGWTNLCIDLIPMGFGYPGGMAEYVTIPARAISNGHVVKVRREVSPRHAALAEPVSCAVNCAENCNIQQGDTVVVTGAGPMGIINACVAREFGAKKIIMAEINQARLKRAEAFGFDLLVDPAKTDLAGLVKDETDGLGADIAIVAAPAAQPQEEALDLVRKRGTVCLFASLSVGKNMLTLDSRTIHYGEVRVVGTSDSTPTQVARAVELITSGTLPVDKLATHILRLDEIFKAYQLMQSGEALRVVLQP